MTFRIELLFMIGSILYILFDIMLVLLIIQNIFRAENEKENKVYSIII